MNNEVYALRRKVMDIIYEIKRDVSIPRIDVRITTCNREILGTARMKDNIIWIPEHTLKMDNNKIFHVVLHEIAHAVWGIEHDEGCPLMASTISSHSKEKIKKTFIKIATNA
jgi:hypothetical protein